MISEQLEFFAIDNPCVGVCRLDNKGYCEGCQRSRQERVEWLKMSDGQKRQVLRLCKQRQLRRQRIQAQELVSQSEQQISLF